MSLQSLSRALYAVILSCMAAPALADDGYADAAELQADLAQVLACEADRAQFMRLGGALSDLHYGDQTQPALAGWSKVEGGSPFVVEFELPAPIEAFGHATRRIAMAGQGLLAILDGVGLETLSDQLSLRESDLPMTGHIRVRTVRTDALGDGLSVEVVQTASAITSHPGRILAGCEYRLAY